MSELHEIAHALVADGKGILADRRARGRSSASIRSASSRRRRTAAYRDLLFTTEGAEEFISGVILYDETIRQSSEDGTPFPKLLESKGIIPGIKVDAGAKPLAARPRRRSREGLDGLRERLEEYREAGRQVRRSGGRCSRSAPAGRASTRSGRTRMRSRGTQR